MDGAGSLIGTTAGGGTYGTGTVFNVTPAGVESVLYSFGVGNDGQDPKTGLILDRAGNLYGTTNVGGTNGAGAVFKITPAGVESVLNSFGIAPHDQYQLPNVGMILDRAGNLYGTTTYGGIIGVGAVFKIN